MDFSIIIESLPVYLEGLWTTVWLVALSLVIGLCIAIPTAILSEDPKHLLVPPVILVKVG